MDVLGVKIIVLILIAAFKLVSGVAPMFLFPRLRKGGVKKKKLDKIMAGILCVGGGFLLATVFVHMIPEVRDTFGTAMAKIRERSDEHQGHEHQGHEDHHGHSHESHDHDDHGHEEHGHHDDYPFAELLICLGFFTIYLLEAIVHKVFLSVHNHSHGPGHGHSHAIPAHMLEDDDSASNSGSRTPGSNQEQLERGSSTSGDSGCDNPAFTKEGSVPSEPPISEASSDRLRDSGMSIGEVSIGALTRNEPSRVADPHPDMSIVDLPKKSGIFRDKDSTGCVGSMGRMGSAKNVYNVSTATLTSYTSYNTDGNPNGSASTPTSFSAASQKGGGASKNEGSASTREKKMMFSIRNFLIVLALSVHSIFEGMAVGLQLRPVDVWKLFLAIAIHDTAIHFCIGMEMISGGIKRLHVVAYFVTLAVVTPVGVVIGIAATYNVGSAGDGATQDLVIAVLSGLAGGTLLYITFYEVLDREKLSKSGMTGLLGCFLLVLGFGAMAGLEAVGGHSHGVVEASNGDTATNPIMGASLRSTDRVPPNLEILKNALLKFKAGQDNQNQKESHFGHAHNDLAGHDNHHQHMDGDHMHDHEDHEDHDHDDNDHGHEDHQHGHEDHDHNHERDDHAHPEPDHHSDHEDDHHGHSHGHSH